MSEQEKAKRILKLYGMEDNDQDMTGFDLGSVRTRQAFEKYAGICFITKEIAPWVRGGAEKS